jgi:hypothetical protein
MKIVLNCKALHHSDIDLLQSPCNTLIKLVGLPFGVKDVQNVCQEIVCLNTGWDENFKMDLKGIE